VEYLAERGVPLQQERAGWKKVRTGSDAPVES